ncbi:MAG: condensation domain-containing protein [Ruminococcus flavefaciens]|nr:condensation domain-containing protein [Ruminococcus flavefaciens]
MFDMTKIKMLSAEKQKELLNAIETNGEKYNIYPLSAEQQQMWFLYMLAPDVPCYNCLMVLNLKKDIDDEKLKEAFGGVIRKHDILHTIYISLQGKVFQSVLGENEYDIPYETVPADGSKAEEQLYEAMYRPFKLQSEIPIRALRQNNRLYIVKHHIALDGWSDGIFVHNFREMLYGEGSEKSIYQYADYCHWQNSYMKSSEYSRHLDFWKEYLKGNKGYLNLPLDSPRGKLQGHKGASKRLVISDELYNKLSLMKTANHTSMYNITLAAWFITLYHFTGQSLINIGTPVANRMKPEFQNIFGCFMHTAAVSCNITDDETADSLISRLRKNMDDILAAQSVPFDRIINELDIERSLSFSPLYQVFYSFQSKTLICRDESDYTDENNEFFEVEPVGMQKVQFVQNDMDILGIDSNGTMTMDIAYNTEIFREDTISFLLENYGCVLEKIAENSTATISALNFSRSDRENNVPADEPENVNTNTASDDIDMSIRKIWEQVLDSTSFSDNQNFFDVGGNSMNCLELMDRLNSEFDCELSIADLFTYNTISMTAEHIRELKNVNTVKDSEQPVIGMMF